MPATTSIVIPDRRRPAGAATRRQAEERLRRVEAGFRLMVESVTDCAIVQLDAQGQVLSWNAGAQRIDGYSAQEIVGRHFSLLYSSEDAGRGAPQRDLAAAASAGRYETRGWRTRKDGSTYRASVVLTPIHDDAGALCGFARLTRDIARPRRREAPRAGPASQPHAVQSHADQPKKASGAPRCKLLYVEDNPASVGALERLMTLGSDLLLLRAADANAGIEIARAERPEVILLNFDLPGSGAIRSMKLLRADGATLNTPVLALGADATPGALARALEAGFFHYLVKPLNAELFLQALRDALEFAARERAEQNDLPVRAASHHLKEPR